MSIEEDIKEVSKMISHWGPALCCQDDSFEADLEDDGVVVIRCIHCKTMQAAMGLKEYKELIGEER